MNPNPSSNRRKFLGTSAAASAAISLGVGMQRFVHAAESNEMRLVLVGSGGRGTGRGRQPAHRQAHQTGCDRRCIRGSGRDVAKALQERFGDQIDVPDERLFVGLDAYKEALACDADLMIQGTPPGFRPLHYRAAIEAGKHVFMEKPLLRGCRRLPLADGNEQAGR